MDDCLNSIIPALSLNFEIPNDSNHYDDEEEEAAEELKREKLIQEDLKNAFDDLIDDDDEVDSQSDGESVGHSLHRYEHEFEQAGVSSIKSSNEHLSKTASSSFQSHLQSNNLEEQSLLSEEDSDDNSSSHRNHRAIDIDVNNKSPSKYSSSSLSNKYGQRQSNSILLRNSNTNCSKEKSDEYVSNYSEQPGNKSTLDTSSSAQLNDQPTDFQEEFMKLQLLYNTRGLEMQEIKREDIQAKIDFSHQIKTLKLRLGLVEGEKDRLSTAIQESQKLITDFRHDNNVLKGTLSALELQLSAEKEAKVSAQSKLESCEVTIQSLEQQINGLSRSENAVRLQTQNESIIKDLKLRHQKDILQLKEEIDKLQENLNAKIHECENMTCNVSELQQKFQELQIEKSDVVYKLSANLEASQRQCQKLLESGTISELSIMKLQFHHVQEEKTKLEKENVSLKEELRSLGGELQTYEALKEFGNENEALHGNGSQVSKKGQSNQKESSLSHELQRSLKSNQNLRQKNSSLKEKLDELQRQLPMWEEKAKLYESRFKESEKNAKEMENKLDQVLPGGSIPTVLHEKELNVLKLELMDIQAKYRDNVNKYKALAANGKKFHEDNLRLKNQISEMQKEHTSEKIEALKKCREKHIEWHEGAVKKLNDELSSKANKELETVCRNYENKIEELQREIKILNDGLYDAKSDYIKVSDENRALQSKIDSISKPKDYQEIEREVRNEFEQKLNEMKDKIKKHQDNFEESVKQEVERIQEDWTKQKMDVIKEFISTTKQRLDEEFNKCLEKEMSKYQSERERFILECEEKIKDIKMQSEAEKENSNANLRDSFEMKWKTKIKELQQNHQHEIQSIRQKFEDTMLRIENEVKVLKEDLSRKSEEHIELQQQYFDEKQAWDAVKSELTSKIDSVNKKLSATVAKEQPLREKVKKYQRYAETLRKRYQERIDLLKSQNNELQDRNTLKDNQLIDLDEQHRHDVMELQQIQKKCSVEINAECQTEEPVVLRKAYVNARNMFIESLRNISDKVNTYLLDSRKRSAEQLNKALHHYHDQIFHHLLQDNSAFMPVMYIPRLNAKNSRASSTSHDNRISPNTMQQQFNAKLTDFTSIDRCASGDMPNRDICYQSGDNHSKILQNAKSSSDSEVRFEDISFDFLPMPDSAFMSTKMPDHLRPGGLFSYKDSIVKSSYPQGV